MAPTSTLSRDSQLHGYHSCEFSGPQLVIPAGAWGWCRLIQLCQALQGTHRLGRTGSEVAWPGRATWSVALDLGFQPNLLSASHLSLSFSHCKLW